LEHTGRPGINGALSSGRKERGPVDRWGLREEASEIRREGRVNHAAFGDDGVDKVGGRDVKGGVEHGDAGGYEASPSNGRHFPGIPLLDFHVSYAVLEVKGGEGGCHVEGYAILLGGEGDGVGAHLVDDGAVIGHEDPVRAADELVDQPPRDEGADGPIARHRDRDAVVLEFKGG
jgi:hypothetical protein